MQMLSNLGLGQQEIQPLADLSPQPQRLPSMNLERMESVTLQRVLDSMARTNMGHPLQDELEHFHADYQNNPCLSDNLISRNFSVISGRDLGFETRNSNLGSKVGSSVLVQGKSIPIMSSFHLSSDSMVRFGRESTLLLRFSANNACESHGILS